MDFAVILVACSVVILAMVISYLRNRQKVGDDYGHIWSQMRGKRRRFHADRTSTTKEQGDCARVPGLPPTDKENGNLAEIGSAGSVYEFLTTLHKDHGPIAGFWMGKQHVVSVASPAIFKKLVHVFNRPPELFRLFEPLITTQSIQYANNEDWKSRRQLYDKAFSHRCLSQYYCAFQQVSDELVKKWSDYGEDSHVPVHKHMIDLAIKAIALTAFGEYFQDQRSLDILQESYDECWTTMERSVVQGFPEQDSEEFKRFAAARASMYKTIQDIIKIRREDRILNDNKLFVDYLQELDDSEERIFGDAITYMVGGFHTTGNMLTWALYYLARDQAVQEKLAFEIHSVLGDNNVNETNIAELKYLRQVQEETMRCSVLAPWAAKFQDIDVELGGYLIPHHTPIIIALGIMLQDETYWKEPKRFDPDRFSPENMKKVPAHAFSPFGLAGKRICPGYRFAFSETAVVLATLLKRFRLQLVQGQDIKPVFGVVTHVSEEVWLTVTKR